MNVATIIRFSGLYPYDQERYNSIDFERHVIRFSRCLAELTGKDVDHQQNFNRLMKFNTTESIDDQTNKILSCLNLTDAQKEERRFLFNENLKIVDKIPVSEKKLEKLEKEIYSRDLDELRLAALYKKSQDEAGIDLSIELTDLSNKVVSQVPNESIEYFATILELSKFQEILSFLSCQKKIILILGAVKFVPYLLVLYKKSYFTNFIQNIVDKLEYRRFFFKYVKQIKMIKDTAFYSITGVGFSYLFFKPFYNWVNSAVGSYMNTFFKNLGFSQTIKNNENSSSAIIVKQKIDQYIETKKEQIQEVKPTEPLPIVNIPFDDVKKFATTSGYIVSALLGSFFKGFQLGVIDEHLKEQKTELTIKESKSEHNEVSSTSLVPFTTNNLKTFLIPAADINIKPLMLPLLNRNFKSLPFALSSSCSNYKTTLNLQKFVTSLNIENNQNLIKNKNIFIKEKIKQKK